MKSFRGVIILLGLIMACLIVLSVLLTIQLVQKAREQNNPTDTAASSVVVSETDNGQNGTQPTGSSSGTASTTPTTNATTGTITTETTTSTSQTTTAKPTTTTAEPNLPGLITPGQAESIALAQLEGDAQILEIEDHTGDNPPHYELELTDGSYEYSLKIHAVTGAIIDFDKEPAGDEDGEEEEING